MGLSASSKKHPLEHRRHRRSSLPSPSHICRETSKWNYRALSLKWMKPTAHLAMKAPGWTRTRSFACRISVQQA
jgi:hypothetical protein